MPETRLPATVLAKASLGGNEYAWRLADVPEVLAAASACGLATIGSVAQFLAPTGTCELYWRNADSEPRRPGEPWAEYVARSAAEVLAGISAFSIEEMVAEGLEWPDVFAVRKTGADVSEYLYFVLYFTAEDE